MRLTLIINTNLIIIIISNKIDIIIYIKENTKMNDVLYSESPDENIFNLQNYTVGELLLLQKRIEGVCAEKSNETRKILWVVSCDGLDLEYFRDTGYIDAINFLSSRALALANNYAPTLKTANDYFFDVRARFIIESEYESYFN